MVMVTSVKRRGGQEEEDIGRDETKGREEREEKRGVEEEKEG